MQGARRCEAEARAGGGGGESGGRGQRPSTAPQRLARVPASRSRRLGRLVPSVSSSTRVYGTSSSRSEARTTRRSLRSGCCSPPPTTRQLGGHLGQERALGVIVRPSPNAGSHRAEPKQESCRAPRGERLCDRRRRPITANGGTGRDSFRRARRRHGGGTVLCAHGRQRRDARVARTRARRALPQRATPPGRVSVVGARSDGADLASTTATETDRSCHGVSVTNREARDPGSAPVSLSRPRRDDGAQRSTSWEESRLSDRAWPLVIHPAARSRGESGSPALRR